MGDPTTATERLLALFEGRHLSPAQRRIARYLLDHLSDAAFLSSVELAARAGVSQPSVTRFAGVLGFAGYPALRDSLRALVMGATVSVDRPNLLQRAVDREIENLRVLHDSLAKPGPLEDLGRRLAASDPLTVVGVSAAATLVTYFAEVARWIHPDVRAVTAGGAHAVEALTQARLAGGQWVLAFALVRYPVELLEAMRAGHAAGLRIAVICDAPFAPPATAADLVFTVPVGVAENNDDPTERGGMLAASFAAPIVFTSLLVRAMARARPSRSRQRLAAESKLLAERRLYLA